MCIATLCSGRARLWNFAALIVLAACAGNPEAPLDILDPDQQPGGNGGAVSGDLAGQQPVAALNASVTAGIAPLTVQFSAAASWSTLGPLAALTWDLGDGHTSGAVEVYHTFVEPGTYTVQLTAYDLLGQANTATVQIAALPPVQIVCTPAAAAGPAPLSVELTVATIGGAARLPDGVQLQWQFGDGTQGSGASVMHVYRQPGRYVVTLALVVGGLLVPGDSLPIVVDVAAGGDNQPPIADAGPNQIVVDDDGDGSALVPLDGSGSYDPDGTIVWYRWTLESGPGAPYVLAEGNTPRRQVPLPLGEHNIMLTVTDNAQATGQAMTKVTVIVAATLVVTPADGFACAGPLGGTFTPRDKLYTLRNAGMQPLLYSAVAGQAWVTLSPTGGTLGSGEAVVVTVAIGTTPPSFGTGVYRDTVTFANLTNSAGTTTREVELTITDPMLPLISGRVTVNGNSLAGVVMNGLPGNPTTNDNGEYSTSVSYGWGNTVTPTKVGYTFNPENWVYSNVTANQTKNYAATLQTFTISGRVTEGGSGLAGVVMNGLPTTPTTDINGDYSVSVNYGWGETVTPSKDGYAFTPVYRTYSNVTSHQADQNYSGTPSQQQMASQVSQYGITWTFDRPYRVGQFITGDWWVLDDQAAGVIVNSVSPAPQNTGNLRDVSFNGASWSEQGYTLTKAAAFAGYTYTPGDRIYISQGSGVVVGWYDVASRISADSITLTGSIGTAASNVGGAVRQQAFAVHGSMVNLTLLQPQAFHGAASSYDGANAFSFPGHLQAGDKLISTVGSDEMGDNRSVYGESWGPGNWRSKLQTAAVLTCVAAVPPPTAFRPPYLGSEMTIFDWADRDLSFLPNLSLPPGSFGVGALGDYDNRWQQYSRIFQRVWLQFRIPGSDDQLHPYDNMPTYYGSGHFCLADAYILASCASVDREALVRNLVQYGIDCWGAYKTGVDAEADRFLCSYPVTFAGTVLGSATLIADAKWDKYWERYRFYYAGRDGNPGPAWTDPTHRPVAYNQACWRKSIGHEFEHLHPADWCSLQWPGEWACRLEGYRLAIQSPPQPGVAIALDRLGIRAEHDCPAFYDYADRWMNEDDTEWHDWINELICTDCGGYSGGTSNRTQGFTGGAGNIREAYWNAYAPLSQSNP